MNGMGYSKSCLAGVRKGFTEEMTFELRPEKMRMKKS